MISKIRYANIVSCLHDFVNVSPLEIEPFDSLPSKAV